MNAAVAENNSSVTPKDSAEKRYLHLKDSEIDPVQTVIDLLREGGHQNPEAWTRDLNPLARDPEVEPRLRRHYVNRKLIEVLGLADENTADARFCLVDDGQMSVWVVILKQSVIPVMIRLGLPNSEF